jgi:hypothetical protein
MTSIDFSQITQYLPILLPLFILQIGLMIAALFDLVRREQVRGQKWIWVIIIIFVNLIGPILYFFIGREDE